MGRKKPKGALPRLIVYEGRLGWYWRFVAANNRALAIGAEPFSSKHKARDAFTLTLRATLWRTEALAQAIPVEIRPRKRRRAR